jgi:HK97 family phage portal protein
MGIFSKLLRSSIIGGGSLTAYDDFWYGVTGGPTKAGTTVNEETALKYLTVFACVSLISGDIARLPLILYQRSKDGSKKRVLDHPLSDILHNAPNPSTTSFNFRESAQNNLLTWGNTYSEIKRAPYKGEILSLARIPVTPGAVSIKKSKRGVIFYEWNDPEKGRQRKRKQDIFHIPGFGFNGLVGMSLIGLARETIGLGMATEEFGSLYFGQGTHPAGVYEMDGYLGDNEESFKKTLKEGYTGLGKSHTIMIAQGGAKYKPMTMPLNDSQFLETRKFQKTEICGMYHVPPHKVAIHDQNSNHNNLEQENSGYVDSCLMHWIIRWEQNISLQLLTREERIQGLFAEFLVDGLLRGDSQARGEFYGKMFQVGALSPNKILAKENMNPIEGGDQHFVQLNMIPLNMAGEFAKENNEPKKEDKAFREYRAKNSILVRDRISKQYYPLFQRAAQSIVNKEGLAVKGQINKQRKNRANSDMQSWLDSFYRKLPAEIKSKVGPVIRSFSEAIQAASADEMGIDVGISEDLEKFIDDYINRYSERHIESSLGQLSSLLKENIDLLEERVDEWEEKRADKIALNETVRNSNAIYQAVAFGVGLSTVWRIRGKTCPYCTSLRGKRVATGQNFVNDGEELNPDGVNGPMKIRGLKAHPPLHQGCDCYLSV